MSPLRNFSHILMASTLVFCEQMDWGDNLDLVVESDTIQGREHIKQLVILEGDTINLECQVAFTSQPVSQFRWKIDGKPETKKVMNCSVVTKNVEVFVEEHLVIENITETMDSSTVSCEYSKGHYGAGVEAIIRVFSLDIVVGRKVWQSCAGDITLVFRESNRRSPAEDAVDKRIKSKISELTKSDKITVDNCGYSVILPIATVIANNAILAMNHKLIINGTQVSKTLAKCDSEAPPPRTYTEVSTTEAQVIMTDSSKTAEIDPKHAEDMNLTNYKFTMEGTDNEHTVEMEHTEDILLTELPLKNVSLPPEDTGSHSPGDSSQAHTELGPRIDKELKRRDLTAKYEEDNWNHLSTEGSTLIEDYNDSNLPMIVLSVIGILIFIIFIATAVFLSIRWRSDCGKCGGKGTDLRRNSCSEPEDEHLFTIIV